MRAVSPLNGYSQKLLLSVNLLRSCRIDFTDAALSVMAMSPSSRWRMLDTYLRRSVAWRYTGAVVTSLVWIALRWLLGHYVINDGYPLCFAVHTSNPLGVFRRTWARAGFGTHDHQPCRLLPDPAALHHRIERFEGSRRNDAVCVVWTGGFGFGRTRPKRNPPGIERG